MDNICKKDLKLNMIDFNILENPYYSKDYVSLYINEDSEIFEYSYEKDQKMFYTISIKRKIKDTSYFDLETAYGFGGYYVNCEDEEFVKEAINSYSEYCYNQNIVAEFIRFDPLNPFPYMYCNYLDFFKIDREVVFVDLSLSEQERIKGYSSTTRKKIKKRLVNTLIQKSYNYKDFIKLYYETMRRQNADEFYYFNEGYFEKITSLEYCDLYGLYIENRPVSMGLFLKSKDVVYYHLGAHDESYNKLNPTYHLFHEVFNIYSKQGYKMIILGGGATPDPNDKIFFFKTRFSKKTLPYYIGGKIFNKKVYNKLINLRDYKNNRFLRYRYE